MVLEKSGNDIHKVLEILFSLDLIRFISTMLLFVFHFSLLLYSSHLLLSPV